MSSADVLRTPGLAQALEDGATALDQVAALQASRADLTARLNAALAEIQALKTPRGIRWGMTAERRGEKTVNDALRRVKAAVPPVTALRYYSQPGEGIRWPVVDSAGPPDAVLTADMEGIALLYSCHPVLTDVPSGKYDADLRAWGQAATLRYRATGQPSTFTVEHEADAKCRKGTLTPAVYKAAAEHCHAILNAEFPAAAIIPCPIFTGELLHDKTGPTLADLWPAGSRLMGWDLYKWQPSTTVPGMLDPLRAVSAQYGVPWAIFETGVDANTHTPAQRQAALTELSRNLSGTAPAPWGVAYFSTNPPKYRWSIDDDPAAAKAWQAGMAGGNG